MSNTHTEQSCTLQVRPGWLNAQNKLPKSCNPMCCNNMVETDVCWRHDSPSKTLFYILIRLLAFGLFFAM